jgi:hypothetical protein
MMDIVVYEYLLTPLIFSMLQLFYRPHINYPLLESGNWIHDCICAGCGCLILQTLKKHTFDTEVDI